MTTSFGQSLVAQQFGLAKNEINNRYKTSGQSNPGLLESILNQVNATQLQESQKVTSMKPSIPEIESMPKIKR